MPTTAETDRDTASRTYLEREILRFTTAGSVDDGKSTLIGRLLFDSKLIFQDQLDALERTRELRGEEEVNLAYLLDGLRAEREQGITIDVAYRYFSTPKRKFIIADTPGHEQYTRNMVTGASTANLAVILVDARNGMVTQSKRHMFIASLLGIPHMLVAVNKMDLVEYSEERYTEIVREFLEFSQKLNVHDIVFIPVSALKGDNVVEHGPNMQWYDGPTLLHHLETVTIASDRNLVDFRFPVQYVNRPHQDFRGFAGKIFSGTIRKGEEICVLPSKKRSKVKEIVTYEGSLEEAFESQSVTITLEDEIDISRGDRETRNTHKALCIWFTGLSGSGKSTLSKALEKRLYEEGMQTFRLDGDNVRHGLCADLGFSPEDRRKNIRRVGQAARLLFDAGQVVLCSFISPYEEPEGAEIVLDTDEKSVESSAEAVYRLLRDKL